MHWGKLSFDAKGIIFHSCFLFWLFFTFLFCIFYFQFFEVRTGVPCIQVATQKALEDWVKGAYTFNPLDYKDKRWACADRNDQCLSLFFNLTFRITKIVWLYLKGSKWWRMMRMKKALNQLSALISSPACANEQCLILSSGMVSDCYVNVTRNKKE